MLVDPEILRVLAGRSGVATADIDAADVGGKMMSAGDPLPGSATRWAAEAVGNHISELAGGLSRDVAKLGTAVRGTGDAFEVADDVLSTAFDGLF